MPRWWYAFPILLSIASILLAIWSVDRAQMGANAALQRVEAPTNKSIEITEPGGYVLFNEYKSWRDGELIESGSQEGLLARVLDANGTTFELGTPLFAHEYDINGARGLAFATFSISRPGWIEIQSQYREGEAQEPAVLSLISTNDLERLDKPGWPLPFAVLGVTVSIIMSGLICNSRIRHLVDYESRAVPTMSSTTLPAPMWRRVAATAIDLFIIIVIMMILAPFAAPLFEQMFGSNSVWVRSVFAILCLVALLAYYVVPEAKLGATPGKFVMSLRTVTAEGRRLGYERSIVRNLIRIIDLLPFCYIAGAITHMVSKDNRRIGDIAADSLVVIR